jgi:hypothetical protein
VTPVYTYYQPLKSIPAPVSLLDLCRESWKKRGFELKILNESDAWEHPGYAEYNRKICALPSINPPGYDRACFMRWMAMAHVGGGLMIDYDVVNYAFTGMGECWPELVFLEPSKVPCAVMGTDKGFKMLCCLLGDYTPRAEDRVNGRQHVSDMTIIRQMADFPASDFCIEYGCSGQPIRDHLGEGWRAAPMVHFSTGSIHRGGYGRMAKHEAIQKIRPI